jgi:hypothetical protein
VRLDLSKEGVFSGRVTFGGKTYSFSGSLDLNGDATVTIPVHDQSPLVLTLQADLTGGSGEITGTITQGSNSLTFVIDQSTYNASTDKAPQAGRYTIVLATDPSTTGTSVPQGSGYAAMDVSVDGDATVAGRLADGTPYSATGHVANDGTLAIYCVPSGSRAGSSLNGLLTFESTNTSDLSGTFTWTKAPDTHDTYYPAGFSTQLPATGSLYVPPASGVKAMAEPSGSATAGFGDGNLPQSLAVPVMVTPQDKVTMVTPGSPNVTLAINPISGTVKGTFVLPDGNITRGVRGVILQKQQAAFGYFLGIDQGGYFSLTPGP